MLGSLVVSQLFSLSFSSVYCACSLVRHEHKQSLPLYNAQQDVLLLQILPLLWFLRGFFSFFFNLSGTGYFNPCSLQGLLVFKSTSDGFGISLDVLLLQRSLQYSASSRWLVVPRYLPPFWFIQQSVLFSSRYILWQYFLLVVATIVTSSSFFLFFGYYSLY